MRILYIGDLVGEHGLKYLETNLAQIKKDNRINLVLINAENTTYGRGLNKEHYTRLMKLGVSGITMGNHTFSNKEIKEFINDSKIVRPANLTTDLGNGYMVINYNGKKICLVNLLGRVYMNNMSLDCPFKTMDNILANVESDYYIVDFHAEATSEKIAFALDFDGLVNAVVGTHTHVATADAKVLENKTLYITDIGMTGSSNHVIGDDKDTIIKRFRSGVYEPAKTQKGPIQFNAVVLDFTFNTISSINILEK